MCNDNNMIGYTIMLMSGSFLQYKLNFILVINLRQLDHSLRFCHATPTSLNTDDLIVGTMATS